MVCNRRLGAVNRMAFQVSVIIPVYGGASLTQACLESVLRHTARDRVEVIVVDDASPDEATKLLLRELDGNRHVRVLRQELNGGFSKACNRGIRAAEAPLLVLLNNDTEVQEGWLPPLLDALGDPKTGAAGCLLLYPGGEAIQHAGIEFYREKGELKPFHFGQFRRAASNSWCRERRDVVAVTGACLAFRKDALPGGVFLDEAYRNGYEDVDLCLRLKAGGWNIRYCGDSCAIHHESVAAGRFVAENDNLRIFQERWKKTAGSLPGPMAKAALQDLRARRRYLQEPEPARAARMAKIAARTHACEEERIWRELAKGRWLSSRRVDAAARTALHKELGLDGISIRSR